MLIKEFKGNPFAYRVRGIPTELTQTLRIDLEAGNFDKFEEDIAAVADKLGTVDKAAVDAILNDNKLIRQLGKDTSEYFTGISFDSLTDQIVQMFADGKTAAADFADTFEDLMKGAILSSFKTNFIHDQLQGWYNQFEELSSSDDTLTAAEVNQLQGSLDDIITNAKAGWEQLQKAAGLDFSTPTDNTASGLQGAIKGITEETAGIIAGQFNAMRITQAEALQVTRQQLISLSKIEANTSYNKYLERLVSIDSKLDALKSDPLRATGSIK
jgi:hypothetical protein